MVAGQQPQFNVQGAGAATNPSSGFAGTGTSSYSTLNITPVQAAQKVTLSTDPTAGGVVGGVSTRTGGVGRQYMTTSVANALAGFTTQYASDPSFAAGIEQDLWDAGAFSSSVYNSGQISAADVYNAYKAVVLHAAATQTPVTTLMQGLQQAWTAQGGAKIKLPAYRIPIPLTSYEDMSLAADRAFEQVLGHRAPDSIKQALTKALNGREQEAGAQKAQGDYSSMLALRGLSPDGTPNVSPMGAANAVLTGAQGAAGAAVTPGVTPPTGTATPPTNTATIGGLPTQVTNAQGQVSTVTQGPVEIPYNQAPSAEALAYNTAMQANPNEVRGRTIAAAMNAIAQFIGQK